MTELETLFAVAASATWPDPPDGWADPWLVGAVHEQAATSTDRKARGAWYTPRSVVVGLVRLATADGVAPARVVDPTCGGGAFLLAGLDRLVELGIDPADAVARVGGIDVDPVAVQASEWSIRLWLGSQLLRRGDAGPIDDRQDHPVDIRHGDSLVSWPADWSGPILVAGNPPFASPLKRGAVPGVAAERREERSELLGPYADIAAVHLLNAVEQAGAGSTVVLVQPQSILSSRDTENLRADLDERAPLTGLWAAREALFDAGVRACAPVLQVGRARRSEPVVVVAAGPDVTVGGERPAQGWGDLAADALGAPSLPPLVGRLGDLVRATAGFRDEHYGLVSVCREAEAGEAGGDAIETARLVTVGSVDPLSLAWGRQPMRFGGHDWDRPIVTRTGLSPRVGRWFDAQLGPKVLLATQSKLLEPVVDRTGDLMPATPLIAIHADPADLDHVAAVLLAPPVVLWAWRRWFGTALTVDGVKLAARQVEELPLPTHQGRWDEAAALIAATDSPDRDGLVPQVGAIMTEAYGAGTEVMDWWLNRLNGVRR
ncbi:MAG: N-6 DNA methylase [Acidimicrobiales bacterium]